MGQTTRAAAALPILEEDSDSSDNDEGNTPNNNNEHNGNSQSQEPQSESTHRPRSGRHLRVHASGNSTSTPYVTDIGYSDDDTRHTVASKRLTLWEQLGQYVEERKAARRRQEGSGWRVRLLRLLLPIQAVVMVVDI